MMTSWWPLRARRSKERAATVSNGLAVVKERPARGLTRHDPLSTAFRNYADVFLMLMRPAVPSSGRRPASPGADAPRRMVGLLTHDVIDEAVKGRDAVACLAAPNEARPVDNPGRPNTPRRRGGCIHAQRAWRAAARPTRARGGVAELGYWSFRSAEITYWRGPRAAPPSGARRDPGRGRRVRRTAERMSNAPECP